MPTVVPHHGGHREACEHGDTVDEEDAVDIANRLAIMRDQAKAEKRKRDADAENKMLEEATILDGEKQGGYLTGGLERFVNGSRAKKDGRCPPMRSIAESGKLRKFQKFFNDTFK